MTLLLAEKQMRQELLTFARVGDWKEFNSLLPFLADILSERGDPEEFWARGEWRSDLDGEAFRIPYQGTVGYARLYTTPELIPQKDSRGFRLNGEILLCFPPLALCWYSNYLRSDLSFLYWRDAEGGWGLRDSCSNLHSFFFPENS